MKKRVMSAICAAAMLANLAPVSAYAAVVPEGKSLTLVLDAVDATGDGVVTAGEDVAVTLSVQDAGWATLENQLPLCVAKFEIGYDSNAVDVVVGELTLENPYAGQLGDTLETYKYIYNENTDLDGAVTVLTEVATKNDYSYASLSDAKTPLFTYHFTAKQDAEAVPAFNITVAEISLGKITESKDDAILLEADQVVKTVNDNLTVDTKGPAITLEGATVADTATFYYTFYYQPIAVAATDGSGEATVTLNGAPVDGSVTTGGSLVATDKYGNTTTITLTVDSKAYDAARAAADALPETITYTDKADIDAAQAAIAAVTDPAAKAKLADAQTKVTEALTAWQAIEDNITAVEERIKALPAPESLTLKDADALLSIQETIAALQEQGVATTDIENYATYEAANAKMADVLEELDEVRAQIAALPDENQVGYGDEKAVKAAEDALEALRAQYPGDVEAINKAVDADRLQAIRTSLDALLGKQKELIDRIANATYKITMFDKDIAVITGLRAEVEEMKGRDAVFTDKQLAPLVQAEKDLAELKAQSEAAHAAIAALPEADAVLYTDKDKIEDARDLMEALAGKDTFSGTETGKLQAAEEAIAAIVTDIGKASDAISQLGTITTDTVTADNIRAVETIREQIEELTAKGVTTVDIANYTVYEAACEAVKPWQDKIDAVEATAAALDELETITFNEKEQLEQAEAALQDLEDQGLTELVEAAATETIQQAREALDALTDSRTQLVQEIQEAKLTISLREADRSVITALRARVTELEKLGATFTAEELANLTQAETEQAALDARSQKAHDALNALPARDEVLYTARAELTALEAELKALEELGDSFAAAERSKLTEAQAGIQDMETAVETLAGEMVKLKDPAEEQTPIQYADLAVLQDLQSRSAALEARGCDVDAMILALEEEDAETYGGAAARYAAYSGAVAEMVGQIEALNAEMTEALEGWKYGETEAFDALREQMDELAALYGIDAEELEQAFPEYETSTRKDAAAKALLEDAADKIAALPAVDALTLADGEKLDAITALLNQLRTDYGFTDEDLAARLGGSYTAYQAALDKLAELGRPTPTPVPTPVTVTVTSDSDEHPEIADAIKDGSWGQPASPTPAPAAQVPQTGDSFHLGLVVLLLGASLCGITACLVALRRKKN